MATVNSCRIDRLAHSVLLHVGCNFIRCRTCQSVGRHWTSPYNFKFRRSFSEPDQMRQQESGFDFVFETDLLSTSNSEHLQCAGVRHNLTQWQENLQPVVRFDHGDNWSVGRLKIGTAFATNSISRQSHMRFRKLPTLGQRRWRILVAAAVQSIKWFAEHLYVLRN